VSRKIASEEERQRLKRIIRASAKWRRRFIVRTAAAGASDEELRADIAFSKTCGPNQVSLRQQQGSSPHLYDLNVVERVCAIR